jgi:mannose-1-phosphate guanylyltransferase
MKLVIICGGHGTKMWPESRIAHPKHFLPLINGKSLFQINWETLAKNFPREDIFLQTIPFQAEIAKQQAPDIIGDNILIEPEMRDQGPATGFSAAMLYQRGFVDEPFMLVQSDVLREPQAEFVKMIGQCDSLVRAKGKLMTGGYRPQFTTKGVDYLIPGDRVTGTGDLIVWTMEQWLGRDEKEKIEDCLRAGRAFLHSNHNCWTPKLWMEALKKLKPDWYQPLMNIINGANVESEYAKMPKGPIEEVTKTILLDGYIVEHVFEWIDFGTWESLDKFYTERGVVQSQEKIINVNSANNFVRKPPNKTVAVIGLNDLAIIDTEDGLLVCPKNRSGEVREVVQALKDNNLTEYL